MRAARQAATIAAHQLHRMTLDRSHLLWLVALPLLIVFVLGASLSSIMGGAFEPTRAFDVALVVGGSPAREAVHQALVAAPDYVRASPSESDEAARRSVLHREADVAVIVPDAFPDDPIEVVGAPWSAAVEVVAAVLRELLAVDDARMAAATGALPVAVSTTAVAAAGPEAGAGATEAWRDASAFRYYSVGMAVFFGLVAAHTALTAHAADRRGALGDRVRALGVRRATHRFGGVLAAATFVASVLFTLILATWGLFGVRWGAPAPMLVLTALGAVAFAGVALALLAFLPQPKAYEAGGMIAVYAMAMLGGSVSPLHVLPEAVANLFTWLPTRALFDGYFALCAGGGWGDLGGPVSRLALGGAVAFVLAAAIFAVRTARGGH